MRRGHRSRGDGIDAVSALRLLRPPPSKWPVIDFVEEMFNFVGMFAEYACNCFQLSDIAQRRRCAVYVDVVDLPGVRCASLIASRIDFMAPIPSVGAVKRWASADLPAAADETAVNLAPRALVRSNPSSTMHRTSPTNTKPSRPVERTRSARDRRCGGEGLHRIETAD